MAACQQEGVGIADLGLDKPKITGRIEQAGIPAFPVWQQFFDLIAKIHARNVTERYRRDNERIGLFENHARAKDARAEKQGAEYEGL